MDLNESNFMKRHFYRFMARFRSNEWDYYMIPQLEKFMEGIVHEVQEEEKRIKSAWEKTQKQVWAILKTPIPMPRFETVKAFSGQTTKIATFSVLLFAMGFLAINAQAYSGIMMAWLSNDFSQEEQLQEKVDDRVPREQELVIVERTPDAQKNQITELNLEIMPPDNRLIIPKIEKDIPLIDTDPAKLMQADWKSLEQTFQDDLQNGVVHYPGTANPGETGNVFVTGHSSYYPWDPGRYKDVFARLNKLEPGDDILIYYDQQKYHYVVRDKKEVKNDDVSVLDQTEENILTLMTCSPVGTNFRRLVVTAEEV